MSPDLPSSVFQSKIRSQSAEFIQRQAAMQPLIDKLWQNLKQSQFQGKTKYLERFHAQGKLTARERVELLLDQDSPFLELMPLVGCGDENATLGGAMIGGVGLVAGKECLINANVPTIKGGAISPEGLKKALRLDEIALENRLPVIYLNESAGADLPQQSLLFNYGGAVFREITRRSKLGIPSIAVVFGSSTAGGAYIPGMCDYTVMVDQQATAFLAGPPLVKMAINETIDAESLGGARMHATRSGSCDYLAHNDQHGIGLARQIMAECVESPALPACTTVKAPLYDPTELLGIVPTDVRIPFDVREVLARVCDGSEFFEFKPEYGSTLVTAFARIHGHPVGILANNGVLFSESANKGSHFIQLCNRQKRPLIYLQNITGFMVGKQAEWGGIIKNGAKLINAVSNSAVPAITVLIGASYGAGNYGMCGRAYQPRFLFSWPNSKLAVMGPEQLAGVMHIIQREAAEKQGQTYNEESGAIMVNAMQELIEYESDAFYGTGKLWDDGIIDPRDTRTVLGLCLSVISRNPFNQPEGYGVFRM